MTCPRVTIVMPVYNGAAFLEDAVLSVLGQTYQDFEMIVVDDGSSDGSQALLDACSDPRVRIIRTEHRGLASALNTGIEATVGEYIARMDSDDVSERTRIEKEVAFLDAHATCVLVGTWARIIDDAGRVTDLWRHPCSDAELRTGLFVHNRFVHGSVMMRRSAVLGMGGYDARLSTAEDYDLWFRLCEMGSVANLPEALYDLRIHGGSKTAREGLAALRSARMVREWAALRAHGREDPLGRAFSTSPGLMAMPPSPPGREQNYSAYLYWAEGSYGYGKRLETCRHALAAARIHPGEVRPWGLLARALLLPRALRGRVRSSLQRVSEGIKSRVRFQTGSRYL